MKPHDQPLPDTLPALRQDLQLHEAAPHADGSPCWSIQDPVGNHFYRIGWLEFELLSRWHLGAPAAVLSALRAETPLDASEEELQALLHFLQQHHLFAIHSPQRTAQLLAIFRGSRLSRAKWLLHHYLFFRIPLWHPDRVLQSLLPWLQWIYSRSMAIAIATACLGGIILAGRQIDLFAASFVDTLSPGGMLAYLIALALAKSLHEMGHALTATRYGVRVAHMGVAFIVMWPMLYTDTGESWRLKDRRQRLAIASAGILTELALASIATLVWALMAPGDLRQAVFFLATTAWLISLGLNASPFMRFDGYFILSDLLDFPNLHERASATARTWMRNTLLGWQDTYPEVFAPRRQKLLIAFAITTWLYRLTVFIGIAIAVYYVFFKLLGVLLFLVEIVWFVALPLLRELKVWRERRQEIGNDRIRLATIGLGAVALLGLVPWNFSVTADAWGHGEAAHAIYAPMPARIAGIAAAPGNVEKDAPLFVLEQPESTMRLQVAQAGEASLQRQLAGLAAVPDGEARRAAMEEQRAMKQAQAGAELDESSRLHITSPVSGTLTDLDPNLAPGVWVSPRDPLAVVVDPSRWTVDAYIEQQDLQRIETGNRARFYVQNDALSALKGRVIDIDRHRASQLPHPMLSARHGGSIPVLQDAAGLTPRDAIYRVRIKLDSPPNSLNVLRGTAVIDASARSWLLEASKSLLVAVIREASF